MPPSPTLDWVNEKRIDGTLYTLWRDSKDPRKQYVQVGDKKPKLLNRGQGQKARNVWNDLDKLKKS